jgi:hypothetical protein
MKLALLALVGVILVLPGCGLADVFVGEDVSTTTIAGGPSSPPPTLTDVSSAPPPAWVETEGGKYWLGFSTYCWESTCADYVAPECSSKHVPTIAVRRGETVRFHLGFQPTRLSIEFFRRTEPTGREKLEPSQAASWAVPHGGVIWLSADVERGDASYVACFRLR